MVVRVAQPGRFIFITPLLVLAWALTSGAAGAGEPLPDELLLPDQILWDDDFASVGEAAGCCEPRTRSLEVPLLGWNLYWDDPGCPWLKPCAGRDSCDGSLQPLFYGLVDLMPLMRDARGTTPAFASAGPGPNNLLLHSPKLSEFEAGPRILLGVALTERYRLEASYFGTHTWNNLAVVRDLELNQQGASGNLFSPFSDFGDPPIPGLDYNHFVGVSLNSKLNNFELNMRQRVFMPPGPWEVSALYGLRVMSVDEQLHYATQSNVPAPGTTSQLATRTDNDLVGIQLGLLGQMLLRTGLWLDVEVKGAMFHNEVSQDTSLLVSGANVAQRRGVDESTTWVGDLAVTLNYHVTPQLTVRGGYQAMRLWGVALAAQNVETDLALLTMGPARVEHGGEVVYHGPHFGIVWAR